MHEYKNEIWKDIPGYIGLYQASNLGRIRGIDRIITYKSGIKKRQKGVVLQPQDVGHGFNYKKVILVDSEHERKYLYVHRLVAMTFIPNPDNLPQVNHKNQLKDDNRVENLEWVSCKDNINFGDRIERMVATRLANRLSLLDKNRSNAELWNL